MDGSLDSFSHLYTSRASFEPNVDQLERFKRPKQKVVRRMWSVRKKAIHEIVSAAGKQAGVDGLCKRCDGIVGWFFLGPKIISLPKIFIAPYPSWDSAQARSYRDLDWEHELDAEIICQLDFKNFSRRRKPPSCKLCSFLYAIRPRNEQDEHDGCGPFHLIVSTVHRMFGDDPRYDNSPIFSIFSDTCTDSEGQRPGEKRPREVGPCDLQDLGRSTVFGFSDADPWRNGIAIRRLSASADLSLVRQWIRLCDDNDTDFHLACLPKGGISLEGFEVIDCQDGRNTLVPYVASMKYVTLSYVWGSEESERPDQSGRLPSALPELIKGVIKVVLDLGYRYLWIDRYCVPQTDSSGIKSRLISNMDKIYSQSTLTIIAATSKCPNEGLAGITRPRVVEQGSLQMGSVHLLEWVDDVQNEVKRSVWNSRGWTYQEALLSRRRLVFTEEQCYFQCAAEDSNGRGNGDSTWRRLESIDVRHGPSMLFTAPEAYFSLLFPLPLPTRTFDSCSWTVIHEFERVVNNYIKRSLSKDSDVLPAFSGILSMFKSENPAFDGHIHGVPIFEGLKSFGNCTDSELALIIGITWSFKLRLWESLDLETFSAAMLSRRREFPSWSWCDWIHASPSPCSITFNTMDLPTDALAFIGEEPRRLEMVLDTTLSLEFENGDTLLWHRESSTQSLADNAMAMGNVRFLHINGWVTHLSIPHCSHSPPNRGMIPFGQYRMTCSDRDVIWLEPLARQRKMNLTGNNEYIFKAWVFALMDGYDIFVRNDRRACMMILGETSDPDIFERIEVLEVSLNESLEYNLDWRGIDQEDIAETLGWEMKAFKLA